MALHDEEQRSSQQWVSALRGDQGYPAQQAAYDALGQKLYGYVYHAVSLSGDAEGLRKSIDELAEIAQNAVQDTLLKLFAQQLYEQYAGKDGAQFTTYMSTVALNRAIDLMRHEWRYEFRSLLEEKVDGDSGDESLPSLIDAGSPDPVVRQAQNALWEDVRGCVAALDEVRRRVFVWIADREIPVQEIATRLGKTENAVYQLYYHARKGICACLIDKGWEIDEVGRLYSGPTA